MSEFNVWLTEDETEETATEIDAFDAQYAAEKFKEQLARDSDNYEYHDEDHCLEVSVNSKLMIEQENFQVITRPQNFICHAEQVT